MIIEHHLSYLVRNIPIWSHMSFRIWFVLLSVMVFYICLVSIAFGDRGGEESGEKVSRLISSASGFVTPSGDVRPIANTSYKDAIPNLWLKNPQKSTVIIYSHGTTDSWYKENCGLFYNAVPDTLLSLEKSKNTYIYYLCSKVKGKRGDQTCPYIYERANEITEVLDQLLALGVVSGNLFLAGHSAGGWSSLMAMETVGQKFNAAIVFAPAFGGKRSQQHPCRTDERPRVVRELSEFLRIEALVFAYEKDPYNRLQELEFLVKAFPDSVQIIQSACNLGIVKTDHLTHLYDCRAVETARLIQEYVKDRRMFSARQ